MNSNLVKTENKLDAKSFRAKDNRTSDLLAEVKQALQLALEESGWSQKNRSGKQKLALRQGLKVRGGTSRLWAVDLALVDQRQVDDPYILIFCIKVTGQRLSESEFSQFFVRLEGPVLDLDRYNPTFVVVRRRDGRKGEEIIPADYKRFLERAGVQVLEWTPTNAANMVVQILRTTKIHFDHERVKGVKSVKETVKILTEKYPTTFVDHTNLNKDTSPLDLIQSIRFLDPDLTTGQIITKVLRRQSICESRIGSYLEAIDDLDLEIMLKGYFNELNHNK